MGAEGAIVSVEFEVFGQVQGIYFTKYCREICDQLGIGGWIKNTKKGTIVGKMQGPRPNIEQILRCSKRENNSYKCCTNAKWVVWLSKTGSPGAKIDRCELTNWENLARPEFRNFSIRF